MQTEQIVNRHLSIVNHFLVYTHQIPCSLLDIEFFVYRLSALADTYESPLSDSVTITPGPTYTWAASTYGSAVVRLTHDMRHELMRCPCSLYPWILDVDPGSNSVWVADALFGDVVEVSADGEILTNLGWFRQPSDIALDYGGRHIWIAVQGEDGIGEVHKLRTNGDGALL